jgi:hypothetical protein
MQVVPFTYSVFQTIKMKANVEGEKQKHARSKSHKVGNAAGFQTFVSGGTRQKSVRQSM